MLHNWHTENQKMFIKHGFDKFIAGGTNAQCLDFNCKRFLEGFSIFLFVCFAVH